MRLPLAVSLLCIACALTVTGCNSSADKHGTGGSQGTGGGGGAGIGQHLKLMDEACDLSLKILAVRESGKSVDEVNQEFAQQIAEMDARIAKLPKPNAEQETKLMQALSGKPREVEKKFGELAEKGKLHDTGKILKLPNYVLMEPEAAK